MADPHTPDSSLSGFFEAHAGRSFPGFAFALLHKGELRYGGFGGFAAAEPEKLETAEATLWDLASLTKPLCTALTALRLHDLGFLDLDAQVIGLSGPPATLLDLLRHEAGFPAWLPLYGRGLDRAAIFGWLLERCPRGAPGERALYSCLDYILLGGCLERMMGRRLDALFEEYVAGPLGLEKDDALFCPPPSLKRRTAATELWGGHEAALAKEKGFLPPPLPEGGLWGVVHDGNARSMGGVSGNAGLFATARGAAALAGAFFPSARFLEAASLERAWEPSGAAGEIRTAGWKRSESPGWTAGAALPAGCIGHEGFTGTGVWLEPKREIVFVLLTNRVHPRHPETDFGPVRAAFLERAQAALGGLS